MCRSRRELSKAYFLAKFGLDTAENEPCQVCPTEQCSSQRAPKDAAEVGAWDAKFADAQALYRHVLAMAREARDHCGLPHRRERGPAGVIFEDLVHCEQLRC